VKNRRGPRSKSALIRLRSITAVVPTSSSPGSYGAPSEVRRLAARRDDAGVVFEYTFDALTPSLREVARRVLVRAVPCPTGASSSSSSDTVMLVAGSTAQRWPKAEAAARHAVETFRVDPAPDFSAAMQSYRRAEQKKAGGASSSVATQN